MDDTNNDGFDESQPDIPAQERPRRSLLCDMLLAYLFWVVGFIIFVHWLLLTYLSNRYQGTRCINCSTLLQFICPLIALAVFAGGGAWSRANSTPCPGGETMSSDCLINVQSTTYQFIYIFHFIGLAYMVIQFILDGIQMWGWILQIRQQGDEGGDSNINDVTSQTRKLFYVVLWSPYAVDRKSVV